MTRGVEVLASAAFAEEHSRFICSIRMRILTPCDGDEYMCPNQRGFDTMQVKSEYMKKSKFCSNLGRPKIETELRSEGAMNGKYYPQLYEGGYNHFEHKVNDVNGDENIRELVLLEACDGNFVFQYYVCAKRQGSFEGYFQCVPSSKDEPSGEMFNVIIAPFPLRYPRFLY